MFDLFIYLLTYLRLNKVVRFGLRDDTVTTKKVIRKMRENLCRSGLRRNCI